MGTPTYHTSKSEIFAYGRNSIAGNCIVINSMILLVPVSIRAVVATDPVKARVVRATNFHATISITGVLWRARSALWPAWCVNAVSAREAGRFVIATRRRSRRGHR